MNANGGSSGGHWPHTQPLKFRHLSVPPVVREETPDCALERVGDRHPITMFNARYNSNLSYMHCWYHNTVS
jgi:hypothetical protein